MEGAALSFIDLPGWERERVGDAVVLLTIDPRPRAATSLVRVAGEAFEIWVGERRVHYKVYKDDDDSDVGVVVFGIF